MTDFHPPLGFEEALRPPVQSGRARIAWPVLRRGGSGGGKGARATLARVARRVPEAMVKVTGKTHDAGHLARHLDYISRNGRLPLEGPDGERLAGRAEVRELVDDWAAELSAEPLRRRGAVSMSIVLSMPAGTEPFRVEDASRAFAERVFGERFAYVFVLHDEDRHPHVHLTVRMSGREGERLNPRKADLHRWREVFAEALRERGVEAEATPRRARGVVQKAERTSLRKARERFEAGAGPMPKVLAGALRDAARGGGEGASWERQAVERQCLIRRAYVAEALALARSNDPHERELGRSVEAFVRGLPKPETRRMRLRDEIAAARNRADVGATRSPEPGSRGRSR
ncbi:relaxase/mobilization nuclease domain-containing protein [Brevundimonas bullata]